MIRSDDIVADHQIIIVAVEKTDPLHRATKGRRRLMGPGQDDVPFHGQILDRALGVALEAVPVRVIHLEAVLDQIVPENAVAVPRMPSQAKPSMTLPSTSECLGNGNPLAYASDRVVADDILVAPQAHRVAYDRKPPGLAPVQVIDGIRAAADFEPFERHVGRRQDRRVRESPRRPLPDARPSCS